MELILDSLALFQKGGPVMYLIAACSLIVAAIAVERFLYYREMSTDTGSLLERLIPVLEQENWQEASQICEQAKGVTAQLALKGIKQLAAGNCALESVLEGEAALAASRLRENLRHLDSIVTIAPLLGLLGTVVGMIQSFSVLNVKTGQPLAITGGVGEALVATASGLCVAVFAMVIYSYFNHRLDSLVTNMEQICVILAGQVKR